MKFKFADEFRRIAEYIEINISEIPAAAANARHTISGSVFS